MIQRTSRCLGVALLATAFGAACHAAPPAVATRPAPPAAGTPRAVAPVAVARRSAAAPRRSAPVRRAADTSGLAFALARERRVDSVQTHLDLEQDIRSARADLITAVHFDRSQDKVRPADRANVERKAEVLRAYPHLRIRIEGNADDRGSDDANRSLALRRAAELRRDLVARGVAESRIETASVGASDPECDGASDDCSRENRRDDIVLIAGDSQWMAGTP